MTTKKNRNKIHASSEKLTTTKKSNIMKGGTLQEARRARKGLDTENAATKATATKATATKAAAEKAAAEAKAAADKAAAEKVAVEKVAVEKAQQAQQRKYDKANKKLLDYISENKLEIKLVNVNGNDVGTSFNGYGFITDVEVSGSIGRAGLNKGDIILSYETINDNDSSNPIIYAFTRNSIKELKIRNQNISKISYITYDSIKKNLYTNEPRNPVDIGYITGALDQIIGERRKNIPGTHLKEIDNHLKSDIETENAVPADDGATPEAVAAKEATATVVATETGAAAKEAAAAEAAKEAAQAAQAAQAAKKAAKETAGEGTEEAADNGSGTGIAPAVEAATADKAAAAVEKAARPISIREADDNATRARGIANKAKELATTNRERVKTAKLVNNHPYINKIMIEAIRSDEKENLTEKQALVADAEAKFANAMQNLTIARSFNSPERTQSSEEKVNLARKEVDETQRSLKIAESQRIKTDDELTEEFKTQTNEDPKPEPRSSAPEPPESRPSAPEPPANTGEKNTSIENAIGAIILALALTISDSNPINNTKKGVGANPFGQRKKLNEEEIKNLQTTYDALKTQIEKDISPKRAENETEFNQIKQIKTAPGNKKSKKEALIKILTNLLTNKRTVESLDNDNPAKKQTAKVSANPATKPAINTESAVGSNDLMSAMQQHAFMSDFPLMAGGHGSDPNVPLTIASDPFYNYRNSEIEKHRRLINEIMNYLFEEKISMRYQWVTIKESANKDKKSYKGKVAIISKLNKDNTNDIANKGKWAFNVWIPDTGGLPVKVSSDDSAIKTKLQVKNSAEEIVDKFHTDNISIYDVEFLDKTYDPKNDMNFQPVIPGENLESIKKTGRLGKGLNAVTSISPVTGTYTNVESIAKSASARGLREDLKGLIKDVIENKFTGEGDIKLLNTTINFYNKKRSIKDILISKISYIFASGETRLNLFNRKNLAKNFKPDDEEGDEAEKDEKGEGEKARGAGAPIEGGGGYGFRNFDKKDAENIIRLILDSLSVLAYEGIPASSRDLLFSTYLKKFLKITPSELNNILQDITRVSALSINVITHYVNRLNGNQEAKEEEDGSPAAQISKLNFALKNNVQAFIGSIVYITLHTEQMVGSKAKIQYYLDNEYNKAMKLPTGEEQTRIDNFHLKKTLDDIFSNENNSIKDYRNKLKTIDSYIDSMNEKNIENVLGDFRTVFKLATLEGEKIIYTIPGNIKAIIKEKAEDKKEAAATEESSTLKLNKAAAQLTTMLASLPKPTEGAEDHKQTALKNNLERLLETLGTPPPS